MTWDALSLEVASLFAEIEDAAEYNAQLTLEWWASERRKAETERDHRRSRTKHRINYVRHWKVVNADMQREYDRRYREKNREKRREYFRARRARLKQQELQRAA